MGILHACSGIVMLYTIFIVIVKLCNFCMYACFNLNALNNWLYMHYMKLRARTLIKEKSCDVWFSSCITAIHRDITYV